MYFPGVVLSASVGSITGTPAVLPHIRSGRIRALAVSTDKRLTGVNLPTVAEAALPGFDAGVWYAMLAPAGTPPEVIE